eukprot:1774973-Rhodomonas_salina.1
MVPPYPTFVRKTWYHHTPHQYQRSGTTIRHVHTTKEVPHRHTTKRGSIPIDMVPTIRQFQYHTRPHQYCTGIGIRVGA